jgi:hypothetical protein
MSDRNCVRNIATKRLPARGLLLALALLPATLPARADSFSYVESSGGAFGRMNLTTGAFQQIGSSLKDPGLGLSVLNGTLYNMGLDGVLNTINPGSGIDTTVGRSLGDCSIPGTSPCGPNAVLAFGSVNGRLYATDLANNLYTVDPSTGKSTLIGSTGMPPVTFIPGVPHPDGTFPGVDESLFSAAGKLYANEDFVVIDPTRPHPLVKVNLADALYSINTATGEATRIAPTITPLNSFVNVNGTEYTFDGNLGEVLTVNRTTGATSAVTNYDPAAGIITGAAPVPEPVSFVLLLAGLAGLAFCKRQASTSIR